MACKYESFGILLMMILISPGSAQSTLSPPSRPPITSSTTGEQQDGSQESEVLIDAKILVVDRAGLKEIVPAAAWPKLNGPGFVVNVSGTLASSLMGAVDTKTLQSFQVATTGEKPAKFRVASRLPSGRSPVDRVSYLDAGFDFQLTSKVSVKREISLKTIVQVLVQPGNNDAVEAAPVFKGRVVHHEIETAEGATILMGGFIDETEARSLANIGSLREGPIFRYLFPGEEQDQLELLLMLTPRIVRAPSITHTLSSSSQPPAGLQKGYTIQVAAFRTRARADALVAQLSQRHSGVFVEKTSAGLTLYRVRLGYLADLQTAKELERQLRAEGFATFVSESK